VGKKSQEEGKLEREKKTQILTKPKKLREKKGTGEKPTGMGSEGKLQGEPLLKKKRG